MNSDAFDLPAERAPQDLASVPVHELEKRLRAGQQSVEAALTALTQTVNSAILSGWRTGHILIELKRRLPHGEFMPAVKRAGIGRTRANDYMRIARGNSAAQITGGGNFSIRQALDLLPGRRRAERRLKTLEGSAP